MCAVTIQKPLSYLSGKVTTKTKWVLCHYVTLAKKVERLRSDTVYRVVQKQHRHTSKRGIMPIICEKGIRGHSLNDE